jgi:hypothetical protein
MVVLLGSDPVHQLVSFLEVKANSNIKMWYHLLTFLPLSTGLSIIRTGNTYAAWATAFNWNTVGSAMLRFN